MALRAGVEGHALCWGCRSTGCRVEADGVDKGRQFILVVYKEYLQKLECLRCKYKIYTYMSF